MTTTLTTTVPAKLRCSTTAKGFVNDWVLGISQMTSQGSNSRLQAVQLALSNTTQQVVIENQAS